MSELFNRISMLCDEKNVSITKMCAESGASRASLTDLKKGRKQSLSAETLSKIASYFDISIDFLLGYTPESYLLTTQYELKQAEKQYEIETDTQKREELAIAIDVLRESLQDQIIGSELMKQQKANDNVSANLLETLRDEDRVLLQVAKSMTPEEVRMMTEFAKKLKGLD